MGGFLRSEQVIPLSLLFSGTRTVSSEAIRGESAVASKEPHPGCGQFKKECYASSSNGCSSSGHGGCALIDRRRGVGATCYRRRQSDL